MKVFTLFKFLLNTGLSQLFVVMSTFICLNKTSFNDAFSTKTITEGLIRCYNTDKYTRENKV